MKNKNRKKKKTSKSSNARAKSIRRPAKRRTKVTSSSILGLIFGFLMIAAGVYGALWQNNPIGYLFVLFGAVVAGFVIWYLVPPARK